MNACATIASLIGSPIPSSLFGVHIRLVADHVRNNAPKRCVRVNLPGNGRQFSKGNATASNAHFGVVAAPAIPGM